MNQITNSNYVVRLAKIITHIIHASMALRKVVCIEYLIQTTNATIEEILSEKKTLFLVNKLKIPRILES